MTIHADVLQALRKCPSFLIPLSRTIGRTEREDWFLVNALSELEEWGLVEHDLIVGYKIVEDDR